jgi:transposase-like protein
LAVARNGSTLAAAKALGTSQSTVHRWLQELEKRLGRSLIKRHPTGYGKGYADVVIVDSDDGGKAYAPAQFAQFYKNVKRYAHARV